MILIPECLVARGGFEGCVDLLLGFLARGPLSGAPGTLARETSVCASMQVSRDPGGRAGGSYVAAILSRIQNH